MSDLKKDMAEKYPHRHIESEKESIPKDKKGMDCIVYKLLKQSILLGILFVVLSIPETYKLVGDAVNGVTSSSMDVSSSVDKKLVFIHGLVFSLVCFVFLYIHEKTISKQN